MKDTTLEGRAKTKNGVTRLVFSVVCILLEVIFVLLLFTGLNRYAPVYKDIGIDCHFKYVCISGYLDDQDAVDFPDYGISDYGTYIVSDGWSERRYE